MKDDKCCYIHCEKKCNGYSMIIIKGFVINYQVCMDHWDQFGKDVVGGRGSLAEEDLK